MEITAMMKYAVKQVLTIVVVVVVVVVVVFVSLSY